MTRCLNCGAGRGGAADECTGCGLSSEAAELVFRRRLVNLSGVFLLGAIAFLSASRFYPLSGAPGAPISQAHLDGRLLHRMYLLFVLPDGQRKGNRQAFGVYRRAPAEKHRL